MPRYKLQIACNKSLSRAFQPYILIILLKMFCKVYVTLIAYIERIQLDIIGIKLYNIVHKE